MARAISIIPLQKIFKPNRTHKAQTDSTCLTSFGHIIDGVRTLPLCFESFDTFSFRARISKTLSFMHGGNAVADKLAKLSKYSHSQVWYDDISYDVQQLVLVDNSFH